MQTAYQHYDWWNIIGVTSMLFIRFSSCRIDPVFFMRKEDFESAEAKWLLLIDRSICIVPCWFAIPE
jgi:hypothetical protein